MRSLKEARQFEHWAYGGMVLQGSEMPGGMQECPDLYSLGGRDILTLNAMNQNEPAESCNIHGHETYALIGSYDPEGKKFLPSYRQILERRLP
jgi:sucrose-6-phosphate hydrolase SacC (GH32 family)